MAVASIYLRSKVGSEAAKKYLGQMIDDGSYDVLITGNADVFKPNGERLCGLRKDVIPASILEAADPAFDVIKKQVSNNRGVYAGGWSKDKPVGPDGKKTRRVVVGEDGKELMVASSIAGYFDPNPRFPFCRETSFTATQVELWRNGLMPLAKVVADCFESSVPDRFKKQMAVVDRSHKDFVIEGTPFTTLTINATVRAAVHYDKGDLKVGFGCMTARRRGRYTGHLLVFPEYRVAVDIGDRDVFFFDAHEMHGNTEMVKVDEWAERTSVVYYFREGLTDCGSAAEELMKAKMRG